MGVMYSYKNMVEQVGNAEQVVEVDIHDVLKQEAESKEPMETDTEIRKWTDSLATDYLD